MAFSISRRGGAYNSSGQHAGGQEPELPTLVDPPFPTTSGESTSYTVSFSDSGHKAPPIQNTSPPSFWLTKNSLLTPAPSPVPRPHFQSNITDQFSLYNTAVSDQKQIHPVLPPSCSKRNHTQSLLSSSSLISNKRLSPSSIDSDQSNNRNTHFSRGHIPEHHLKYSMPLITDNSNPKSIDHVFSDVFDKMDDDSKAHILQSLVDLSGREVLVNVLGYISPKLKRDPFSVLPNELSLKILSFIDDPKTLSRASQVSRLWHLVLSDDLTWKALCQSHHYRRLSAATIMTRSNMAPSNDMPIEFPVEKDPATMIHRTSFSGNASGNFDMPVLSAFEFNEGVTKRPHPTTYKSHFRLQYLQNSEWEHGGRLAAKYVVMSGRRVVTALIMTDKHIVASLDDSSIYVFRPNGQLIKTLIGNVMGVWALALQGDTLVSGGCDKDIRVWDLEKFQCTQILHGHQSTVRCLKIVNDRIAVSGARDNTVRVWDIREGKCLHVLNDHDSSVRCVEVCGDICVSGSYDFTAKVWRLSTGELLHTLRGHESQIYSLAFDGKRIVTGSLDMTAHVWDPETGRCLAVLRGHTSLVGHVQILNDTLVSGGSDGTLRVWDLNTFDCLQRIAAHDNSVTTLQFDNERIVSGGSDGKVEVWELKTGRHIRTLSGPFSAVWCVAFRDDKLMIAASQEERIHMELVSFVPPLPYDAEPESAGAITFSHDNGAPTPASSSSPNKHFEFQQGATSPFSLSNVGSPHDSNPFDKH